MRKDTILSLLIMMLWLIPSMVSAQHSRLARHGDAMQLQVDGHPYIIIGGELGNSSASCFEDIDRIFPHLERLGLNTVLVPAYWDLLEPQEGVFDFSLTDHVLEKARECHLKVVFLWFGAWKNSMSCYAPEWFKRDYKRFPRAYTKEGKPLEIASAFSENVFQADKKAFTTWLSHVAQNDKDHGTVIMLQIENEIGMLESARDHSPAANKAYTQWLKQEAAETKATKTGQQNDSVLYEEERFMASAYAKYVERLAQEARKIYDVPLYVNAAMNSRGRKPGEYPSAGPLAHLKDIWHKHAPSIDILAPDLYDNGFKMWVNRYALPDNPLFIPEIKNAANNGVQAFYVFGEKSAIGFSPFSIEDKQLWPQRHSPYRMLQELTPLITKHQGTRDINGILFDQEDRDTVICRDGLRLKCSHFFTLPWDSRATDGSRWPDGGGLIIHLNKNEYLVAGSGIVVTFEHETEQNALRQLGEDGFANAGSDSAEQKTSNWKAEKRIGIASCDEVSVAADGSLKYIRRLNGDQDHQGRHVRIGVDDFQILHVKLYEYK